MYNICRDSIASYYNMLASIQAWHDEFRALLVNHVYECIDIVNSNIEWFDDNGDLYIIKSVRGIDTKIIVNVLNCLQNEEMEIDFIKFSNETQKRIFAAVIKFIIDEDVN